MKYQLNLKNITDYISLEGPTIGQGQFGKVRLCTHLESGEKLAIKTVRKRDLKIVEIY